MNITIMRKNTMDGIENKWYNTTNFQKRRRKKRLRWSIREKTFFASRWYKIFLAIKANEKEIFVNSWTKWMPAIGNLQWDNAQSSSYIVTSKSFLKRKLNRHTNNKKRRQKHHIGCNRTNAKSDKSSARSLSSSSSSLLFLLHLDLECTV